MNNDTEVKRGIAAVWETLQCPICLDLMTQPVSTKCDHQFCRFCMLKLLENTKRIAANCPVCKEKITKRSLRESQSFQRLITGVQDMIQAYENDTGTNYFTGLAQEKMQSHVTDDEQFDKSPNKLEGVEKALSSCHSTKAALQGFAKVMGFDHSDPLTTEGEVQEGALRDSVPTTQCMESREAPVKISRFVTLRKRRKDQVVPAVLKNQKLMQSGGQKSDLEIEEISKKKKMESVEKVAEWLLKVPVEGSLVLDDPTEVAQFSDDLNCSHSLQDINTFHHKEQVTKTLEDQVFGATYKRERKSYPGATTRNLSNSSGKQPRLTSVTLPDVMKSPEEKGEVPTANIHSEDVDSSPENNENDQIDFHSLEIVHLKRKPIKRLRSALQQDDSDLQTKAKMESLGPKKTDKRRSSSERSKFTKHVKPLVLVGVQNDDDLAKSNLPQEAVQVHIENYPSSEDQELAVTTCIRRSRSRRLLLQQAPIISTAKEQGANTLKSLNAKGPSVLSAKTKCKINGCVYDKELCTIENMEISGLENPLMEVPQTESEACADPDPPPGPNSPTFIGVPPEEPVPCLSPNAPTEKENYNDSTMETEELFKSFKPTKMKSPLTTQQGEKSPVKEVKDNGTLILSASKESKNNRCENMEITVVSVTESKAFADPDPPPIPCLPKVNGVVPEDPVHCSIPSNPREKDENCNDSEMDTEQLFKSFKPIKRKSFRLTRSNGKQSPSVDENPVRTLENSNPARSGVQCAKEQRIPRLDLADPSPGSDLNPPTNFPSKKMDSEAMATSVLLRSTVSSVLSPNKVEARETESPVVSFIPQIGSSGLCFHERERQETPESMLETSTRESQKNTTESHTDAGSSLVTAYQHLLETDCSMTPDGLDVPLGLPSLGTETSPPLSNRSNPRRKTQKRARRLQYTSESQSSFSQKLPTLTQIFHKVAPPTQGDCAAKANWQEASTEANTQESNAEADGKESDAEANGQEALAKANGHESDAEGDWHDDVEVRGRSLSLDYFEASQASVDLFDLPYENDAPVNCASISADSSQFATELLVTQQKMEMQKELVRLEKLMALVTEVLQEKEANPTVCPVVKISDVRDLDENHNSDSKTLASVTEEPDRRPHNVEQFSQPTKEMPTTLSAAEKRVAESNSTSSDKENKTPERDRNRAKMVLVSSGLAPAEQITVKRFAKRLGARVVSRVTAEVTHIVMCTDEQLVCERTLKYFLGIAGRKWVVSFNWIAECFKQKKLLDENLYEVRGDVVNGSDHLGPMKARTSNDDNLLMRDYEICLQGPFLDMTTEEMEWMVQLCGATVAKSPLELQRKRKSNQLVIVQTGSVPSSYSCLSKQVPVVTRGWLLDTVGTYTLQGYGNYLA
ncbi:uncharacterized protein LOC144092525 [Stigmatopora argus]